VDRLLEVLNERAADPDTDSDVGPQSDWAIDVNSVVTRVRARTKVLSEDPETAWRAATELRDAIAGLGYELRGGSGVGVAAEDGPNYSVRGWRGSVDLLVATKRAR
jgi:hypothetical protein